MTARRALADTSVFIGHEASRLTDGALAALELGVSVVTLGELRLGVVSATAPQVTARRLATYELARQFEPFVVDERVSETWALLVAKLRADGRKVPVNDTWIAATALANDLPVATQDRDYEALPGLEVIRL